jgi:hypothetical protein
MNEDQLAKLHDDLVNSKSRRGKHGGIGAGDRHSILMDGPRKPVSNSDLSRMPDRPLYNRFVKATKKELCRQTVLAVLEHNGGKVRWDELVVLVAQECGEPLTKEFRYKVLVNIPEACLSSSSPIVTLVK